MAPRLLATAVAVAALTSVLGAPACGTDATGTDACRKIEQARCRKAAACPELGLKGAVGVEECVQYARDRCLHGLAVADPGPQIVDACVNAVEQATTCDVVAFPEATAPACAFLTPVPIIDAGVDASPEDAAGPDAPSASDAPDGG
jgi:hypothetical protein